MERVSSEIDPLGRGGPAEKINVAGKMAGCANNVDRAIVEEIKRVQERTERFPG